MVRGSSSVLVVAGRGVGLRRGCGFCLGLESGRWLAGEEGVESGDGVIPVFLHVAACRSQRLVWVWPRLRWVFKTASLLEPLINLFPADVESDDVAHRLGRQQRQALDVPQVNFGGYRRRRRLDDVGVKLFTGVVGPLEENTLLANHFAEHGDFSAQSAGQSAGFVVVSLGFTVLYSLALLAGFARVRLLPVNDTPEAEGAGDEDGKQRQAA